MKLFLATALLGAAVAAPLALVGGQGAVGAGGELPECWTVSTDPPVGSHHPEVTVCRPW